MSDSVPKQVFLRYLKESIFLLQIKLNNFPNNLPDFLCFFIFSKVYHHLLTKHIESLRVLNFPNHPIWIFLQVLDLLTEFFLNYPLKSNLNSSLHIQLLTEESQRLAKMYYSAILIQNNLYFWHRFEVALAFLGKLVISHRLTLSIRGRLKE